MALLIDQAQAFQHVSRRTAMFTQLMADPELEWIVPFLRLLYASGSRSHNEVRRSSIVLLVRAPSNLARHPLRA